MFVELSCGKKRTFYLIWGTERNYFGGNEGVKGGRGKGGRVKGGRGEGGKGKGGSASGDKGLFLSLDGQGAVHQAPASQSAITISVISIWNEMRKIKMSLGIP